MATVEELDFRLIIDDSEFNEQIEKDIKAAESLNAEISQLLDIKAKTRDLSISVDTTEAVGGLKELNDYYRSLEEAEWNKIGEGLNVEEYVQNTLAQLRQLEEEIEVIQELRRENPEGEGLAEAYRNANVQAQNLLATIQALREAEKNLGGGNSQFREYIQSLTEPSIEYLQLVEQMKEEERVARELEKAKQEEAKAREKAASAREKERNAASKAANGEFKEYIQSLTQVNDELAEMNAYYRQLEREGEETEKNTESFGKQSKVMRELKSLAAGYVSVLGAKNLVSNIVRITAEFELQRVTLSAILQDAAKANELFEQIKDLAVRSPFNFKELATYAKQLSAYSIPAEELYETTKMLADVSAGLGVGMDRLVLAYGQIRSASFLRGQEVRQLTEAGIPILEELRKQFVELGEEGITVGDVFDKISKRMVPFAMVEKVFKDMTSEGGKFYQMQEVQAETLRGKLSNLKDAYQIMFSEIGDKQSGLLKGTVDFIRMMIENYEKVGKIILELVSGFGLYTTAVIIAEVANKKFELSNHKVLNSLVETAKRLKAFIVKNPYAVLAAAATAAVVALVKVGRELWGTSEAMKNLEKAQKEYASSAASEEVALDTLYAKLKLAKEGTKDYESAKKSILSKYKPYIDALREEGKEVNNLADIYDDLKEKVLEAARVRFINSASEQAKNDLEKRTEEIQKAFAKRFEKGMTGGPKGFKAASAVQKEAMWRYITGGIDYNELRNYVPAGWAGFIDWMRKDFKKAADEYREIVRQIGEAETAFNDNGENVEALSGWRKEVQNVLDLFEKKGYRVLGLAADSTTGLEEYVSGLAKERKELNAEMDLAEKNDKELYEEDKNRLEVIEAINKALHGVLDSYEESKQKAKKGGKTQEQKDLETRIDLLKKLLSAYEQLSEYVGDDKMGDLLSKFFASSEVKDKDKIIRSLDYRGQLIKAAVELEKYDKEAAEKLRSFIGYDEVTEQINAFKELVKQQREAQRAGEQYEEFMKDWLSGTELNGEGSEYKLSKIVSDYSKALEKITNKADEARKKLYAEADAEKKVGTWSALGFSKDYNEITDKANADTANTFIEYSEKGRDALKKMYEEWRNGAMDFNNLSDKTLGQLKAMRTLIDKFSTDNKDVFSPDVIANLKELGISLEDAQKIIEKLKGGDVGKLDFEIKDETIDQWEKIVSEISNAASAVKEYADAIGNDNLSSVMEGIIGMADIASGVLSRLAQGDIIGAVVAGVSSLFQKVMDSVTASARLTRAISQAADEAERMKASLRLSGGVDTVFGENSFASIRNAISLMKEYQSAVDTNKSQANRNITWKSGLFNWGRSSKELSAIVSELGYDLYDVYGNLNSQALQAILDTYENLTTADREWIEDAIKNAEIYTEAAEQFKDAIEGTWSSLASGMADKLITARKEVGDAYHALADDLRITFGDMADDIAHKLVESFIIDQILNNYKDDLESIYKMMNNGSGKEQIASAFATMANSIIEDSALAADFTNKLYDALEQYGISFTEGSENLANGIKGITEDAANLSASYLNAIRADVSFNKTQIATISTDIKQILGLLPVTPTLNDYLNQIQANTFDTAQSNREILSRIDSVLGLGNEGSALRVITT